MSIAEIHVVLDGEHATIESIAGLRESTGTSRARVTVELLPPLVEARVISLPRMRSGEIDLVLRRNLDRYFLSGGADRLVTWERVGRGSRAAQPLLVYLTSAALIEQVAEAVTSVGWEVGRISPAHATLFAAHRARQSVSFPASLLLTQQGSAVLIQGSDGVGRIQRLSPHRIPELAGTPAIIEPIEAVALAAGHRPERTAEFVPPAVGEARRRWSKRFEQSALMLGAAMLVLAAGLERWRLSLELNAVREARSAISAPVARALDQREALTLSVDRLVALDRLERTAQPWTDIVGGIAQQLPGDAFLANLRAEGDTLLIEGEADDAAAVFEALARIPGIKSVRANAPIRQQSSPDGPPIERFSIKATIGDRPNRTTAPEL
jgi:hypothetical protein